MPEENKERYTPGPWKVERNAIYSAMPPGEIVALTKSNYDVRLIAEASNMFILLKEYLKQHAMCNEEEPGEGCPCHECIAARAIITRVLGE